MINLLSPEYKKELLREEYYKIINTLGIFIFLSLICFSLILYSVKIYTTAQLNTAKNLVEQYQEKMQFSEIEKTEQEVKSINKQINNLNLFYQNQVKLVEILEGIYQTFPSGIYLTDLSLNLSKEEGYRFLASLSGFSPNREKLYELKNNLEAKENFLAEKPYFPPSSWIEAIDIDFNINLKIK